MLVFTCAALTATGLDRLVLVPGAGPLVGGDGATHGVGKLRVALAGHYEHAPLQLDATWANGDAVKATVLAYRVQAHLLASFGVLERFDLQVQLPLTVSQRGDELSSLGLKTPEPFGVGSPVIGARYGVLATRAEQPLDLAVQLGVSVPVGTVAALTGRRLALLPSVHASRSFSHLHLAGSVGASIEERQALGAQALGSTFELTGMVGYGADWRVELVSRSVFSFEGAPSTSELLLGGRALALGPVDLFLLGGPTFGDAPGVPAFRVLAGVGLNVTYLKPPDPCSGPHTPEQCPLLDDDGDKVPNGVDRCVLAPEDPDGFEDDDGCAELDNDGDSVKDLDDKCRDVAGVAAYEGCPIPDTDGDGVLDPHDECPKEAGLVERRGCAFRDRDGDAIEDGVDACPDEAGAVELKGCAPKDADADGVFDHVDNCPREKGPADNQGCPPKKKQLVVVTARAIEIKQKVQFLSGKAVIDKRSFALLDQVAQVLVDHPEIAHVDVEGHTDNVGNPKTNERLSQARAEAVVAYLVKKKVDRARLAAHGYGESRPMADNTTKQGREGNRRVEFTIPAAPAAPATP